MLSSIPILAIALSLPLTVLSQTTSAAAAVPSAIVPFSTLPSCAQQCGPLFDAQGACTPPNIASVSISCFCAYGTLQPFYTSTLNVCNNACPSDPNGLLNIQKWFVGVCASSSSTTAASGSATSTAASGTATSAPASSGSSSGQTTNNTWWNSHWRWVVMIIVIVVAIIGLWIGACLLRRRYVRKKEMQYELRPPAIPWAESSTKGAGPYGFNDGTMDSRAAGKQKGVDPYVSPADARLASANRTEKKKWVVKERT